MNKAFSNFTARQIKTLKALDTPAKIQDFVEALDYNSEPNGETAYSPKQVLELRKAHCLEGAVFAACAMRYHGLPPLLLDLRSVRDEDHVLCVFQKEGLWGSVGKSKFAGLRSRDPVYASLRELVMSYFENYFNNAGEKTLREYSKPVDLRKYNRLEWMTTPDGLWFLTDALENAPHEKLFEKQPKLRRVKGELMQAQMLTHPKRSVLNDAGFLKKKLAALTNRKS